VHADQEQADAAEQAGDDVEGGQGWGFQGGLRGGCGNRR